MATKRKTARAKETFTRYDSADYLRSPEDIAAYLDAAFAEGADDPAFLAHALGVVARAHGMVDLAQKTGLTREGLYKALSPSGNPSMGTVLKVLRALNIELHTQAA